MLCNKPFLQENSWTAYAACHERWKLSFHFKTEKSVWRICFCCVRWTFIWQENNARGAQIEKKPKCLRAGAWKSLRQITWSWASRRLEVYGRISVQSLKFGGCFCNCRKQKPRERKLRDQKNQNNLKKNCDRTPVTGAKFLAKTSC